MAASPMEVLERIGNIQSIPEYFKLITEDPRRFKGMTALGRTKTFAI